MEFARSQQEQQQLMEIDALKRIGRNFMRVAYRGRVTYSNGVPIAPRFHGLDVVSARQVYDSDLGRNKWIAVEGNLSTDCVEFRMVGSDLVADILETMHNKFWVSRHIAANGIPNDRETLEMLDTDKRPEILKLKAMPFKVEVTREDELLRKRKEIDTELERIQKAKPEAAPQEIAQAAQGLGIGPKVDAPAAPVSQAPKKSWGFQRGHKPLPRRRQQSDRLNAALNYARPGQIAPQTGSTGNGNDKPAADMGGTGVPRVEPGRPTGVAGAAERSAPHPDGAQDRAQPAG
jgi:hypothetical protein